MTSNIRQHVAALLADDDPDARRRAAEMLAGSNSPAPMAALAAALQDENKGVRDAALRSLHAIGGANVARAIVKYIGNENIVTRNLASELLIKLGSVSVPALVPYLQDPSSDVRKFAVDILGLIGDDSPAGQMLLLLGDPDPNVVVSTTEALGNLKSRESLPHLFRVYQANAFARATAAEAIGKIGDGRATEFLLTRLADELHGSAGDRVVVFALVEALGLTGGSEARDALLAHAGAVQGKIRSALLHAVMQISERLHARPPWLPALKPDLIFALRDDTPAVRMSAAHWLSECADGDVTASFVGGLGASPEMDRLLSDLLLERPDAFSRATEVLDSAAPVACKSAIMFIGRCACALIQKIMRSHQFVYDESLFGEAFTKIASLWGAADEDTRAAIVDALFRLDGDRAVEFLDVIMNDPDPWLRMHVIEIIAAIADPRAPVFIARFLTDDDEMVREMAEGVLRNKGCDPAMLSPGEEG